MYELYNVSLLLDTKSYMTQSKAVHDGVQP